MKDDKREILRNAERLQRQGRIGDSMHLRILASELKQMRVGPEITHDTTS